jgi:hypothetical protein
MTTAMRTLKSKLENLKQTLASHWKRRGNPLQRLRRAMT